MNTIDIRIGNKQQSFPSSYLPTEQEACRLILDAAETLPDGRLRITAGDKTWEEPASAVQDKQYTRDYRLEIAAAGLAREAFAGKVTASRVVTINGTRTYVPTEVLSLQTLRNYRMWSHFRVFFETGVNATNKAVVNGKDYPMPGAPIWSAEFIKACHKALLHALTGRRS